MIYYLIDYENTGENGLRGITELNENSCIIIFYSENADKISFDMHQKLMECRASVEYRKISTGKRNALDFQLSTYLGYLIAKCEEDTFYIISKDNGYRVVIDFWKDWDVRQIDRIALSIPKADSPVLLSFMPLPVSEPKAANEPQPANAPQLESEPQPVNVPQSAGEPQPVNAPQLAGEPQPVNAPQLAGEPQPENAPQSAGEPQLAGEPQPVNAPQSVVEPQPISESKEAPVLESAFETEASSAPTTVTVTEVPENETRMESGQPVLKVPLSAKELREQVALVIPDAEEQENICRFITKYKTKQGVNNAIVKLYGSEKAGELYKKIKPLIKDKKGK